MSWVKTTHYEIWGCVYTRHSVMCNPTLQTKLRVAQYVAKLSQNQQKQDPFHQNLNVFQLCQE